MVAPSPVPVSLSPTAIATAAVLGQVNTCGTVTAYASDGGQMLVTLAGPNATRMYRLTPQLSDVSIPRDIGVLLAAKTPQLISISGQEVSPETGVPEAVNLRPFTMTRVTTCAFGVPVPVTPVPIPVTIRGTVNWNHHPQSDVEVLLSDTGAPWPCQPTSARARTLTLSGGVFNFYVGLPASAAVGVQVCAHGPFEYSGHAINVSGAVADAGSIDLARTIAGLSIRDGDRVPMGPLTIRWDAVPEATAYCVAVWAVNAGYTGPYCLPLAPGARITTNSFTTTSLAPGLYTIGVTALTDVVIGIRANTGLSFTVAAP